MAKPDTPDRDEAQRPASRSEREEVVRFLKMMRPMDEAANMIIKRAIVLLDAPLSEQQRTEVWEVYNRTTSILCATEKDADAYMGQFGASVGMNKMLRHVVRFAQPTERKEP